MGISQLLLLPDEYVFNISGTTLEIFRHIVYDAAVDASCDDIRHGVEASYYLD